MSSEDRIAQEIDRLIGADPRLPDPTDPIVRASTWCTIPMLAWQIGLIVAVIAIFAFSAAQ